MHLASDASLQTRPQTTEASVTLARALDHLTRGLHFSREGMAELMDALLGADLPATQVAALLFGLRMRGETRAELVGAAAALRRRAIGLPLRTMPDLDTCGTGGDGSGSLNLSTISAIIAASCGVTVAKHGNRSVSSRCGSTDVLGALGVAVETTPGEIARSIETIGIGFLFAPAHHPAMGKVAAVRRSLGVRTLFNLVGPLANPAGVRTQLLGVYHPEKVRVVAEALAELGTERALVVSAPPGLDEIAPEGPTVTVELIGGMLTERVLTPEDFGVQSAPMASIAGGEPAENADAIRAILEGAPHPARSAVLMNAGAALYVAGAAEDYRHGAVRAAQAIDGGAARATLASLQGQQQIAAA